jgi:hypothetical protein
MKVYPVLWWWFITCMMLITGNAAAQRKISFDLSAIRSMRSNLNGLNMSGFYHFNEKLTGGVEINRFFSVKSNIKKETAQLSAWDVDFNFHYLLPLSDHLKFYPLTGFSHTSENEIIPDLNESLYERFWSFNTGAGVLWELHKWSPHIEYNYTWGHLDQQFLLVGISYEIEWRHALEKK